MGDIYFKKEHERLATTYSGWFGLEGRTIVEGLHKKTRPVAWISERGKRSTGYAYLASGVFLLPNLPEHRIARGGMTFEPRYLKDTFFPKMLDELIAYKLNEDGGNRLAMSVYYSDPESPQAIVTGVNSDFCRMHAPLTSLFVARLDPILGTLDYCSAGHPPALLFRESGEFESLTKGGMLLGMTADASFTTSHAELAAGDTLVAYTDGVTESRNGADEEFGEERLETQLRFARTGSAESVLFSLLAAVQDFAAPQALSDDTSLVVVRRTAHATETG